MEDIKLGAKSLTFGIVAVVHGILTIILLILFPISEGSKQLFLAVIISLFTLIIITFGLTALIKGIKNFIRSRKNKNIEHNKLLSMVGMILGIISLLKGIIILLIFIITLVFVIYLNKYNSASNKKNDRNYEFNQKPDIQKTIYFYEIKSPIRTSLKDGKNIQIKLSLAYNNENSESEIIEKEGKIKEALSEFLSAKNSFDIITDEEMSKIEYEMIKIINKELTTGKIIKIYILEYTLM